MKLAEMLPLLARLPAQSARRAVLALLAREESGNRESLNREPASSDAPTLHGFAARAEAAFAKDMQPVVTALASALHANDLAALKGLQALLPGLLREVNRAPALADLLALQLGAAFLEGMKADDVTVHASTDHAP